MDGGTSGIKRDYRPEAGIGRSCFMQLFGMGVAKSGFHCSAGDAAALTGAGLHGRYAGKKAPGKQMRCRVLSVLRAAASMLLWRYSITWMMTE